MSIVANDPKAGADLVLQSLLTGVDIIPAFSTKFNTSGRLNSFGTINELMNLTCSGTICIGPNTIGNSNVLDNSADINFTANGSASGTFMSWREVGTTNWTVESNVTSPVNITGLTACSEYEYYFNSICSGTDTSSNTSTQTFTTTGCSQCIGGPYCANSATDGTDEWIEEFTIGTYTNTSGNDNGYGNFTATSNISLVKGTAYNVIVDPEWGGGMYNEQSRIWIDLDQNGIFDPADLVYDQGAATQTNATGTVTIPLTAIDGSTRMRVQLAYIGIGQTTLPANCNTYTWGEVEDYCVDIQSSSPCSLMITESIIDVSCNGGVDGSINLGTVTGGTAPYSYVWLPNGETTSNITGSAGSYSVDIIDAVACTSNYTYVIGEPNVLNGTATSTLITNGSNGSVDLTVTGGVSPYTYDWNSGFSLDEDLINVSVAGTYICDITDNNGCTVQVTVTVDSDLGIGGAILSQLNIYPNPSNGKVNVAFNASVNAKVTVFNSVGQKLLEEDNLGEDILVLDLSSFATGIYVIKIITEDGIQRNERITIAK
tara:strand:- start:780 stop:2408 length:1629 start_codon:yes stop_codon:yes gene_type:complete